MRNEPKKTAHDLDNIAGNCVAIIKPNETIEARVNFEVRLFQ